MLKMRTNTKRKEEEKRMNKICQCCGNLIINNMHKRKAKYCRSCGRQLFRLVNKRTIRMRNFYEAKIRQMKEYYERRYYDRLNLH